VAFDDEIRSVDDLLTAALWAQEGSNLMSPKTKDFYVTKRLPW